MALLFAARMASEGLPVFSAWLTRWPDPAAQKIRRPMPDKSALLLETKDGVISYALGINAQRDLAAIRRLIERKIPVDAEALADPAKPFNAMLKAKA